MMARCPQRRNERGIDVMEIRQQWLEHEDGSVTDDMWVGDQGAERQIVDHPVEGVGVDGDGDPEKRDARGQEKQAEPRQNECGLRSPHDSEVRVWSLTVRYSR